MKNLRPLLIVFVILLAACNSGPSSALPKVTATPTGPQAQVVDLVNQVEAHATAEVSWTPAAVDMLIYQGGEVRALEASTARLRIEETLVRVAPNTVFSFNQPSDGTLQIDLQEGQVWLNVEGLEAGQQFQVQTPTAVGSVRGTRFSVRVEPDGSSLFSVVNGNVDVTGAGETVNVQEGQQSTVAPGQPPSEPAPIGLPESIRWGMAFGPNLDAVLPAYGEPIVTQEKGILTDGPFYSTDGKWLFYHIYDRSSGADSYNSLWNLDEKNTAPISLPEGTFQVSFNPLDGRIAYAAGNEICTSAVDGSTPSCFAQSGQYQNVAWSPDGQWLLFGSSDYGSQNLFVARPDGSDFDILAGASTGFAVNGTWSPDGSKVAYVQADNLSGPGQLWVVNSDASKPKQVFDDLPYAYLPTFAWQPDGNGLVAAGSNGLSLVQLDGSSSALETQPGSYSSLSWSPNATGWPLFYTYKPNDENQASASYLLADGQSQPVMMGDWQYGPYWMQAGNFILFGDISIVENGDNSYYQTEFYRFPANYDFMP